jgi:hypothetical protein
VWVLLNLFVKLRMCLFFEVCCSCMYFRFVWVTELSVSIRCTGFVWLSDCMEHGHSTDASSRLANQDSYRILWKLILIGYRLFCCFKESLMVIFRSSGQLHCCVFRYTLITQKKYTESFEALSSSHCLHYCHLPTKLHGVTSKPSLIFHIQSEDVY